MLRHGKMSVWGKFWMFNLLLVRQVLCVRLMARHT
jgi:hypothetical protein